MLRRGVRVYLKSLGKSATEAHLRSILATIPDALIIIDDMGMILSFSAAAEKLFGYLEDEVAGENVSMLMPSPDRERHDGYLESYRVPGRPAPSGRVDFTRSLPSSHACFLRR